MKIRTRASLRGGFLGLCIGFAFATTAGGVIGIAVLGLIAGYKIPALGE